MKKEIQILLTGSLFLNACAPVVAQALESDQNKTPKTSTPEALPTFITIPTQTETPYQIPTLEPVDTNSTQEIVLTPDVLFFSQFDYKNQFFKDGTSWSDASCGIMVDSMITKQQPLDFYQYFLSYFKSIGKDGDERITKLGSDLDDHIAVLGSLGYTFEEIRSEGNSLDDIKSKIKESTSLGIPVFVKANIWTGYDWYGHYSLAIGVNENGEIVYNDSVYGPGVTIAESSEQAAQRSETHWISLSQFFAVYPPQK